MNLLLAFAIAEFVIIVLLLLGSALELSRYSNRASTDAQAIKQMRLIIDYYQGRTTQPPTTIQPDLFENLT